MSLKLAKQCYIMSSNKVTSECMSPLIYNTVNELVWNQNSEIAADAADILDSIGKENYN